VRDFVGNVLAEEGPACRDSRVVFPEFGLNPVSIFQRTASSAIAEHSLTTCGVTWQFGKEPAESPFRRVWEARTVAKPNVRIR
jgi:hypothetical protein